MSKEFLLKIARKAIENENFEPKEIPNWAKEKRGVFVTITKNNELRGCIGFILPLYPLWKGTIKAAREAAYGDPRFPPLDKDEIKEIKIEISILTKPKELNGNPKEFPNKIKIGRDGIIISKGIFSGILLPQVATEYHLSPIEFLDETCAKAGLPSKCWMNSKVYTFQAEIVSEPSEEKPNK